MSLTILKTCWSFLLRRATRLFEVRIFLIMFDDVGSAEFRKVHVLGNYFGLSPTIINNYLGSGRLINGDCILSMKTIAQEITENIHDDWSAKGLLIASNLSVKYVVLYKIGVAN